MHSAIAVENCATLERQKLLMRRNFEIIPNAKKFAAKLINSVISTCHSGHRSYGIRLFSALLCFNQLQY